MNIESVKQKLEDACNWVASKDTKNIKIDPGVKWVEWSKKRFSPAYCVIYKSKVTGLNFVPPEYNTWHQIVANELGVTVSWVYDFINCCMNPTGNKTTLHFSGDISSFLEEDLELYIGFNTQKVYFNDSAFEVAKFISEKYPSQFKFKRNFEQLSSDNINSRKQFLKMKIAEYLTEFNSIKE